jgi:lipooligosaccharide transport system ATP-binding protein
MSTHYIEEAERLADTVAVISAGRVIATDTPTALLRSHAGAQAAEFDGDERRRREVEKLAADHGLSTRRTGLAVAVLKAEAMPAELRDRLGTPATLRRSTLEDVFVAITGEDFG